MTSIFLLQFVGTDVEMQRMEVIELQDHPFFVAVQEPILRNFFLTQLMLLARQILMNDLRLELILYLDKLSQDLSGSNSTSKSSSKLQPLAFSVTRFANFCQFGLFLSLCLFLLGFSNWQNFVPTLANFHCCKWPNINHQVTLLVAISDGQKNCYCIGPPPSIIRNTFQGQ